MSHHNIFSHITVAFLRSLPLQLHAYNFTSLDFVKLFAQHYKIIITIIIVIIINYLQPINITQMEKIFSELVFGDTFPNPTLVRLLNVK